ncbi:MAG: helix-turn-helix domain-containing protein [Mucilaginibacter sp.]
MLIPFEFNSYSVLLLPAFVHGMLFAVLSVVRYSKERKLHDLMLGLLLLLLSIRICFWMLGFAGWYDRHDGYTTVMFYFPFNTISLIGPCLYFYFLSLTKADIKVTRAYWPHFVLPTAILLLCIVKFLADFLWFIPFPKTEPYQYGTRGPFAELDKTTIVYFLSYASVLYYLWLILRSFKKYEAYLVQNFSDLKDIQLKWLKRVIWGTVGTILFMALFYFLGMVGPKFSYIIDWYPYFFLGLAVYYISINGYYNNSGLFNYLHFELTSISKEISVSLPDLAEWRTKLIKLMNEEKPFLDAGLTLTKLARLLQTNPQTASKIINDGFGQNFNDYINGLRVQEVIMLLNKGAHHKFSLMGIAFDSGFNSKTTFNRAFKKATGLSPSSYIEQLVGSNDKLSR